MTTEPLVSQQIKTSNTLLWAVKTYLDLISNDTNVVSGSGLKRLYVMKSGIATLNDTDIQAIVAKADRLKLLPDQLGGFMISSILKNIELYGKELQRLIQSRIVAIANGDVRNPEARLKYSPEAARRYFYAPDANFVARLSKALEQDRGFDYLNSSPPVVVKLSDVVIDAEILLTRAQIDEGHLVPTETSWGALIKGVEGLIDVLEQEARYPIADRSYRNRPRSALKILWFITKLLMGDLTPNPKAGDLNRVALTQKYKFTDGTLASIPFPLPATVELFQDDCCHGMSVKGHLYLSAVSAAAFYRAPPSENDR